MRPLVVLVLLAACTRTPGADTKGPTDEDGDGYAVDDDCDDTLGTVHPNAPERCNGIDDDCDRYTDEDVVETYFPDTDGDGFGDLLGTATAGCEAPAGYVEDATDCDDTDAAVFPGAEEACNGTDDDCDGVADDASRAWYLDADGDGYGAPGTALDTCAPGADRVLDATDCDDTDPLVNPGAVEQCDYDDDNCDGRADQGVVHVWHSDTDGDGYGHMYTLEETCDPPDGWVLDGTDCRPGDAEAFPGAPERCNGDDDDCDMVVDEGMDADGDGHRSAACADGDDCDDTDAATFPGGVEVCEDGLDQDCDGGDDACGFAGDILLSGADAKLYSGTASYDLGRHFGHGDLDGDGVEDLVAATLYAEGYGGGGYVVSGARSGIVDIDTVGSQIVGTMARTYGAGRSVGVGDVDADGQDDVAFGAPYGDFPGQYIVFGPITSDRDLTDYDAWLEGRGGAYSGHGSDLGDLDGDGVADGAVGSYYGSYGGVRTGTVHIAYGPLVGGTERSLEDDADVYIGGEEVSSLTGRWVRAGADLDGDGIGDLVVAAPYTSVGGAGSGSVYVVYGPPSDMSLADADGRFSGDSPDDLAGEGINTGDVDGDGLADLLLCATGDAAYARAAGAAFVFFGPASGTADITAADVALYGDTAGQYVGHSIATSDVDGDGRGDVLVGAYRDDTAGPTAGAAYLFYGPAGSYVMSDADAGFFGEATGSYTGLGVALADLDADGMGEVYVGAPGDATGGAGAGAVYVVQPAR